MPPTNISKDKLKELKEKHPTSSWAIWSEGFPEEGCIEEGIESDKDIIYNFIKRNRKNLNPSVVLLSLNPSQEIPRKPFSNFHYPKEIYPRTRDGVLKKSIQKNNLEELKGAFMTDLSKKVTPNSEEISIDDVNWDEFMKKLDILGEDEYYIVCLGIGVHEFFKKCLDEKEGLSLPEGCPVSVDGLELNHYGIYHYSQGHGKGCKEQLKYLNNQVLKSD